MFIICIDIKIAVPIGMNILRFPMISRIHYCYIFFYIIHNVIINGLYIIYHLWINKIVIYNVIIVYCVLTYSPFIIA